MRILFTALVLVLSVQAQAWNTIIECNDREFVVDQGDNDSMGRPTYQLVLRGEPLNYFFESDAVDKKHVNEKGEFIVSVDTYDGDLKGFLLYESPTPGLHTYRNYWVSRHDSDVTIRATIGNTYIGESEKANWKFHNCH